MEAEPRLVVTVAGTPGLVIQGVVASDRCLVKVKRTLLLKLPPRSQPLLTKLACLLELLLEQPQVERARRGNYQLFPWSSSLVTPEPDAGPRFGDNMILWKEWVSPQPARLHRARLKRKCLSE